MSQASDLKPVLFGLGSNVDMRRHILQAIEALEGICTLHYITPFYKNEAIGIQVKPEYQFYVNGVVYGMTVLTLDVLNDRLKHIEAEIGRKRNSQACAIDIDILAYADYTGPCGRHRIPRLVDTDPYYWRCIEEGESMTDGSWEKIALQELKNRNYDKKPLMQEYLQFILK
ncbi:MAG TPA: hypothetical protein DHW71_14200 [Gammaproteobacteria bacterium]|nr:hypothetical protein [Gammaproteobacteria bacterium]HBF08298.1 hypothetical protein [Gammaproteobacteria bacterium]HCK94144.1 hypothetical protein [Gammaproteobacteria bacterium]